MKSKLQAKDDLDKTENGQQQVQKLDDDTESKLGNVAACYSAVGYASSSSRSKKRALDDAGESMDALRSRIRELIEEARKEDAVVTVYCDGLSLRLARGQCYSAAIFGLGDTQVFLESETGRGDDKLIEDQFEAREGMRFYRAGRFIND